MNIRNIKKIITPTDQKDPHKVLKDFLKTNLIWLPIFMVFYLTLKDNFHISPQNILRASIIPYTSANFSLLGSLVFLKSERFIFKTLKKERPIHSKNWWIILSIFLTFIGMYLGFQILGYEPFLRDYGIGAMYASVFIAIYFGFDLTQSYKQQTFDKEQKIQKLEKQSLHAKLAALSAQLNPHLLFNALNTIAATIPENSEKAEEMVIQLSELYRAILKATQQKQHSLKEELYLSKSYLEIETARFNERLNYNIDVADDINLESIQTPVLLLQPIVENSVKHGISPKREGGLISIKIFRKNDCIHIEVSDNGIGSRTSQSLGEHCGVENCSSRLKLHFGIRSEFDFKLSEQGAITSIVFPEKGDFNA